MHIMKCKGFKTFAYIDDFILINPKAKAQQAFDTLTDLLQELGLPMNNDKRSSSTRALTCLGICIDLNTHTMSIDKGKVEATCNQCMLRDDIQLNDQGCKMKRIVYSDKTSDQQLLQNFRENYQWFKIPMSYFLIDMSV